MILLRNEDVVVERRASDGRFVLFTGTDVRPGWLLPWWGAVWDTGGDGHCILARLDEPAAPEGWTARQLLHVIRRRLADEAARCPLPVTLEAVAALDLCAVARVERFATPFTPPSVSFRLARPPSPYQWTVATQSGHAIPLCPDPESREEGVTPEQLLIVLDQLLLDAERAAPSAALRRARVNLAVALAAEVKRVACVRG